MQIKLDEKEIVSLCAFNVDAQAILHEIVSLNLATTIKVIIINVPMFLGMLIMLNPSLMRKPWDFKEEATKLFREKDKRRLGGKWPSGGKS